MGISQSELRNGDKTVGSTESLHTGGNRGSEVRQRRNQSFLRPIRWLMQDENQSQAK
jgi:hypothetical protein